MDDYETDEAIEAEEADEPKSARGWLKAIKDAEEAFATYQDKCDNIDKLYADLDMLASTTRDRQFQMFWANIQVLGPAVYARPPVPVVVPRFKDRKPLPRAASEILERCAITAFDIEDIDYVMRSVRDDLTISARGAIWLRYETAKGSYGSENVCIEHTDRKDFLHQPARKWKEVDWVAKRSWLSKDAMRKRFEKHSGEAYHDAAYAVRKTEAGQKTDDDEAKAGVWEIWCKSEKRTYWVNESVDVYLDDDKPELSLEGFFPCPRPAYGTTQRRTLIPVPDYAFYKDQLEEINELTARISALTDAVKVRGFYPAGAGEIGDAIESAVKMNSNNKILIGVSNWAMVGTGGVKDMIIWLPLDMITKTISELVNLRKQLISDVYEITGLSDIMRGSTEASETATAQQLKSQYGSIRIRDRQNELIRIAKDVARICCEIMAENFSPQTLLAMSQYDIPSEADLHQQTVQAKMQAQQQVDGLNQQLQDNPEAAPQLQQQAQQIQQELNEQIQGIMEQPSIEKVMQLYRDERMRPFVLDIETDSTIAPDENAQKQRANEFLQAVGGFMVQAQPLIQAAPQAAPVLAEGLKFVASQYRAGRQLYQVIDEFADNMKQLAQQPQQPNPEQQKAQAEQAAAQQQAQIDGQKAQADAQTAQADAQEKQANAQKTMIEAQGKAQDDDLNRRVTEQKEMDAARQRQIDLDSKEATARLELQKSAEKHQQDMEIGALKIEEQKLKIRQTQVQTNATIATTKASINQKNQATANGIATAQASLDQSGDGEELDLDDGAEQRAAERADAKRAAEERHAVAFEKLSGVMESLHGAVQHMSRPKRIVRDMNGRASHVETVE